MRQLKKWTAICLAIVLLFVSIIPCSYAVEETPLIEEAIVFTGTDDGEMLYLRLGDSVCGVSKALRIKFIPNEESEWEPPIIDSAGVIVEQPCAANGEHFELFAPLGFESVSPRAQVSVDGLMLRTGGEPVSDTTITLEPGTTDMQALQIHYPDPEISACINHYLEQDVDEKDYVIYCTEGDALTFETKWDFLRDRLSASWDGSLQMHAAADGTQQYTAVSGTGSLTLHVMEHIRYSSKVQVMTQRDRRKLLVRSAAANPKQRLSAWFEICLMVPTMSLFPLSVVLYPIVLPLAVLAAPVGDAVELLYMLFTGKPLQMMR